MGKAAELALNDYAPDLAALRDGFEQRLSAGWPDAVIHGRQAPRLPNTTSICLPGVDAAALLGLLDQRGIACSGGSACHTLSLHPSHVLAAMGYDASHAASTLRFSFSRMNTRDEVSAAAEAVIHSARHILDQRDTSGGPVEFA